MKCLVCFTFFFLAKNTFSGNKIKHKSLKQIAEILIKEFAKNYNFKYHFFRYGSLYGKRSQEWNGINKFISQILKNNSITFDSLSLPFMP